MKNRIVLQHVLDSKTMLGGVLKPGFVSSTPPEDLRSDFIITKLSLERETNGLFFRRNWEKSEIEWPNIQRYIPICEQLHPNLQVHSLVIPTSELVRTVSEDSELLLSYTTYTSGQYEFIHSDTGTATVLVRLIPTPSSFRVISYSINPIEGLGQWVKRLIELV